MKINEYRYSDGSGNLYRISGDSLEYIPVTPERSSSGMYSGGDPALKKISSEEYQQVKLAIDTIITAKEIHVADRMKTTGMVVVDKEKGKDEVIVVKSSPQKDALEKLLKGLLGKD